VTLAYITWTLTSGRSSPLVPLNGTWWIRLRLSWKPPRHSSNTNHSVDGAWSRTWTSTGVDARQSTFWGPCCSLLRSHSRARPRQPGPCVPTGWQNSWVPSTPLCIYNGSTPHTPGPNYTNTHRVLLRQTNRQTGWSVGCFFNDDVSTNLLAVQLSTGSQVRSQPGTEEWQRTDWMGLSHN
jgi:hypothetical protein